MKELVKVPSWKEKELLVLSLDPVELPSRIRRRFDHKTERLVVGRYRNKIGRYSVMYGNTMKINDAFKRIRSILYHRPDYWSIDDIKRCLERVLRFITVRKVELPELTKRILLTPRNMKRIRDYDPRFKTKTIKFRPKIRAYHIRESLVNYLQSSHFMKGIYATGQVEELFIDPLLPELKYHFKMMSPEGNDDFDLYLDGWMRELWVTADKVIEDGN